jgi:hypothetical protein
MPALANNAATIAFLDPSADTGDLFRIDPHGNGPLVSVEVNLPVQACRNPPSLPVGGFR